MNLKKLSDTILLSDTKNLVAREREISFQVLLHLKEIERRRLHSDLGFSSVFDYATNELGYSASSAMRRINSARLLEDLPEIGKKVENGVLNLTNLSNAAQLFKNEDISDKEMRLIVLAQIENKTTRECDKVLMTFGSPHAIPSETIRRVSTDLHTIKMNISEDTLLKFNELKNLVAHRRYNSDALMDFMIQTSIYEVEQKKFKINAKLRSAPKSPCIGRFIPSIVKKEVYERDGGKCTKCGGTYKLEYDHIKPFSFGGESTVKNLRILCFSCNQRRVISSNTWKRAPKAL